MFRLHLSCQCLPTFIEIMFLWLSLYLFLRETPQQYHCNRNDHKTLDWKQWWCRNLGRRIVVLSKVNLLDNAAVQLFRLLHSYFQIPWNPGNWKKDLVSNLSPKCWFPISLSAAHQMLHRTWSQVFLANNVQCHSITLMCFCHVLWAAIAGKFEHVRTTTLRERERNQGCQKLLTWTLRVKSLQKGFRISGSCSMLWHTWKLVKNFQKHG